MKIFDLVLRVVLSVSLALYGAGSTQAAIAMDLGMTGAGVAHATPHGAAATGEAAEVAGSCHPDSGSGMHGSSMHHATALAPLAHASQSDPHPHAPDCCKGKGCQCVCAGQATVAFVTLAIPGAALHTAGPAAYITASHASPGVAHLIRPPIG